MVITSYKQEKLVTMETNEEEMAVTNNAFLKYVETTKSKEMSNAIMTTQKLMGMAAILIA